MSDRSPLRQALDTAIDQAANNGGGKVWSRVNRREFVTTMLELGRRHGDIPLYGSDEWEALDRLDPRRFAAVVAAAECWRQDGDLEVIRERLREELEFNDRLAAWRLRRMSNDLAGATDWAEAASRPSWVELERRRELQEVA